MSMPVVTYQCTACDLNRWSSVTWGYRYYLHGKTQLQMQVTMGWCHSCHNLTAIEVLPTLEQETALQSQLDTLRAALQATTTSPAPKKRWWQRRPRKSDEQYQLEFDISVVEEQLTDHQTLRTALAQRTSHARCLACSSENCLALPPHQRDYFDTESTPLPTRFIHPSCDGEIVTLGDGLRLNMRLSDQAYDLEGLPQE